MAKTTSKMTLAQTSLPKFETEALFLQAIAGLLIRLPGVEGVQQLHGPQEFGKDLVFWTMGPLGEKIACACVLKRDSITGDARRRSGARNVLTQVEQSLDTPYSDGSGQDIWVQRVYVLTPRNISAEAINSVRGALRGRAGQIFLMGGHELFSLFKKYWPDYYADEAAALTNYFTRMRTQLRVHSPLELLTSFYDLGNVDGTTKSVYVQLDIQRDLGKYLARIDGLLIQRADLVKLSAKASPGVDSRNTAKARAKSFREFKVRFRGLAVELQRLLTYLVDRSFCSIHSETQRAIDNYVLSIGGNWSPKEPTEVINARDALKEVMRKDLSLLYEYENNILPLICQNNKLSVSPDELLGSAIYKKAMMVDQCFSEYYTSEAPAKSFILTGPQWRQSKGSFLVAGEPGSGKTSFCKWNALQDVEYYTTGESSVLPIYIPLQSIPETPPSNLSELVEVAAPLSAFLGDVRAQLEGGKFSYARLYCDGLDEVPTRDRRIALINVLLAGMTEDPRFQLVVTTRDYVKGKELDWLPRLHIRGLDQRQIKELCEQWLGEESPAVCEFLSQLQAYPPLAELVRVPLLATLTILVFRRTGRLPDSRGRLYTMFVELLAGGWDLAKGVLRSSRFGRDIKLIVLSRLAENVHRARTRVFGIQEIKDAARNSSMRPAGSTGWDYFANELMEDGLLVLAGDGRLFQFRHLSFQEYLAARELLSNPDSTPASQVLSEFLQGDVWWKEVLDFYLLLSGNPRKLWTWLSSVSNASGGPLQQIEYLKKSLLKAYPNFSVPGQ